KPLLSSSVNPFVLSLLLSVIVGGVFYAGTWWISGLLNPRHDKTVKRSTNNKPCDRASIPAVEQEAEMPKADFSSSALRKESF
ncbi:MAG TPA: hypothetical protein V6C91_17900, partial [Coleofasciculaceae cyanobacterium]